MPHSQNPPEFLVDAPARPAPLTFAFAHGAGAPMDTPFMSFFATGLAAHGWRVVRFEFPYMARRRSESGRSPDRKTGGEGRRVSVRVDLGGRCCLQKKKHSRTNYNYN